MGSEGVAAVVTVFLQLLELAFVFASFFCFFSFHFGLFSAIQLGIKKKSLYARVTSVSVSQLNVLLLVSADYS